MKLSKSDVVMVLLVLGISLLVFICYYLNQVPIQNSKLVINRSVLQKTLPVVSLPLHQLNTIKSTSNLENFRMPYDEEYVDPFMFYAEVTLEQDPADLLLPPGVSPEYDSDFEEEAKEEAKEEEKEEEEAKKKDIKPKKRDDDLIKGYKTDPNFQNECEPVEEIIGGITHKYRFRKDSSLLGTMYEKLFNRRCTNIFGNKNKKKEIQAYQLGNDSFFQNCMEVDEEDLDTDSPAESYTHKYRFRQGSVLLGTMYEKLFHQKCTRNFKNKKEVNADKLKKLQVTQFQLDKLNGIVDQYDYLIKDKDIKHLENLLKEGHPEVDKKMEGYLKKKCEKDKDAKNMYLTKKSEKGENRVDTIQSLSNNKEKSSPDENSLTMCLKRYKGDEDRCFLPRKKDKTTFCQIPECYSPLLVIGSCSITGYDMEPYFFENNAHFRIQEHPKYPKKRIIYLNVDNDPRRCEGDPAYFNNYLEILRYKRLIELLKNEISLLKTNPVELTEEQKKEYQELEKKIKKLESDTGSFEKEPDGGSVDYHEVTKARNKELKEAKDRYANFTQKIRDEMMEKKTKEKEELEEKLTGFEKKDEEFDKEKVLVSKRICLKYAKMGRAILVRLLYEDDRRNLFKNFKSDWYIEKYIDDSGNDTGFFKIRAKIGKQKYNLSKKPRPKETGFIGFALPKFEPSPKMEDQLWMIKEVGDLNEDIDLGETQEEREIKKIGEDEDNTIKEKHDKPGGGAEFEPRPRKSWEDNIETKDDNKKNNTNNSGGY